MFDTNIDKVKFKKLFEANEEEYFGRQISFIEEFDTNYGTKFEDS